PVPAVGAYDVGLRYARRVDSVDAGTPAARAALQAGDWIAAVDGTPVSQQDSLTDLIQRAAFGQPLRVTVRRDGERTDVEIRPEAMTDDLRIPVGEDTFLGIRPGASTEHGIPVREVLPDGPAADRLAAGDVIVALDGEPVRTDAPLGHQVAERQTRPIELTLVRNGERRQVGIRPEVRPEVGVARIGIRLGDLRIEGVDPGSIAERLGLGPQDRQFRFELSADLATTTLSWDREGEAERMRTSFPTPASVREDPVAAGLVGQPPLQLKARFVMDQADGLWAACSAALPDAWEKTTAIYRFIHRLVTRKISPTAMGGPILIFSAMYHSVDVGWGRLLDMAALISINLAVLNLLPIPVLDGGHILFLFIEGITGSRPSARVREYAQYAGFLCLLGLMLMVTAFDIYFHVFQG
ncbi:MAG: site-2 protease family protein, partial [Planctomycetota bacterium]